MFEFVLDFINFAYSPNLLFKIFKNAKPTKMITQMMNRLTVANSLIIILFRDPLARI
jgi:hypothetical protein